VFQDFLAKGRTPAPQLEAVRRIPYISKDYPSCFGGS